MSLHDLNETIALPDPVTGRIKVPSLMRNSHMFMGSNGVYLLGKGLKPSYHSRQVADPVFRQRGGHDDLDREQCVSANTT